MCVRQLHTLYKQYRFLQKPTVASLQTPHFTTCWWIFPSTEIRLWHTLQLITGALPLSGEVRGEYGGGSSPRSTEGWVGLGNGGKPAQGEEEKNSEYKKSSTTCGKWIDSWGNTVAYVTGGGRGKKIPQFPWRVTSYVTNNKIIRFGLEFNWKEL